MSCYSNNENVILYYYETFRFRLLTPAWISHALRDHRRHFISIHSAIFICTDPSIIPPQIVFLGRAYCATLPSRGLPDHHKIQFCNYQTKHCRRKLCEFHWKNKFKANIARYARHLLIKKERHNVEHLWENLKLCEWVKKSF